MTFGGSLRPSGGGALSADPSWQLISEIAASLTLDQGSGAAVAPDDPTTMGGSGTGFDTSDGQATIVGDAHTTSIDGYQEGHLCWSVALDQLWPGLTEPEKYLFEFGLEFIQFDRKTNGIGAVLGMIDRDPGSSAYLAANGSMFGVRAQNASNYQGYEITSTIAGSGVGLLGSGIDELRGAWTPERLSGGTYKYRGVASLFEAGDAVEDWYSASALDFQAGVSNHRLYFGVFHTATTTLLGETLRFNVYGKRSPRGAVPFS